MNDSVSIKIDEDRARLIGSREHNLHVANGVNLHRRTDVAPASLLTPLSDKQIAALNSKQESVEAALRGAIGSPFFAAPGFILFNGDCREYLDKLASSSVKFNLTITSPPYNIGKEYERNLPVQQYVSWCSTWMKAIHRVTSEFGSFWLNLGFFEVPGAGLCVPIAYLLWNKSAFFLLQEVVWAYGAGVAAKTRLSPRNEKWLYFVRNPQSYTFNLDEIRDPNVKFPNQKKKGKFRCNPLGKNPSDVWEFPKVTTGEQRSSKERTKHPAQFPLGVVQRIARASSNVLDLVLDPFSGSGSVGIAAAGLGRIFIGFELRQDYCAMSAARYQEYIDGRTKAAQRELEQT
jgi:adenine-specific DNA-methyltransferase